VLKLFQSIFRLTSCEMQSVCSVEPKLWLPYLERTAVIHLGAACHIPYHGKPASRRWRVHPD
jgi:hypothetical protein